MTAAQAASMSTLLPPVASAPDRTVQQDAGRPGDGAWQRAFETASQDAPPTTAIAAEASYLLALGNLGAAPVETQPQASAALPAAPLPAPDAAAAAQQPDHVEADRQPAARAPSAARASVLARTSALGEEASTHAVSHAAVTATAAPGPAARRGERASVPRRPAVSEGDHAGPAALPRNASPAPAAHAITAYSAAMSAAAMPVEREANFSIVPRSTSVPVRVHVQWRDRVADVWIGLHRRAFDQLPDIRAGVQDWVTARGGVLGHVVCNGETLARVAPSIDFQGAL